MSQLEQITNLTTLAKEILSLTGEVEPDLFHQKTNYYLEQFGKWQDSVESDGLSVGDDPDNPLREALAQLLSHHEQVVARVEMLKGEVLDALTDVHKRGKALRSYVDRYPSRITIAGKRKG